MSIRYMNWAMAQRLDGPSAQCVLYVIADCADQDGKTIIRTAYIAERTRQSSKTVQRRLQELEDAGLLVRLIRKNKGGLRISDELRLQMARTVVVSSPAEKNSPEEPGMAQDVDDLVTYENNSAGTICPGSVDTGVQAAWTQESRRSGHSCPDMNPRLYPSKNPEEAPQSPPRLRVVEMSEGEEVTLGKENSSPADQGPSFQDFTRNYPIPILHLSECLNIWSVYDGEERAYAVGGAAVYAEFIRAYDRRPIDAVRFLRERTWEGLKQQAVSAPLNRVSVATSDDNGRAWLNVCVAAFAAVGDPPEPPYYWRVPGAMISVLSEWPPGGRAWLTPHADWVFVEKGAKQYYAYAERVREMFQRDPMLRRGKARDGHRLISTDGTGWGTREFHGLLVPTEWPPPKGANGKRSALELNADEINAFLGT